jgi:hypothetical protein
VAPETFSSELGDAHEHGDAKRDSFSNEFRGASQSLIETHRPPSINGRGRVGLVFAIVLLFASLGGGAWALWYWSEPIGQWIAGLGRQTDPADSEPASEAEQPVAALTPDLPVEPAVEKVFGIRGVPDGSSNDPVPLPTPEPPLPSETQPLQPDPPTQPDAPVQPSPSGGSIQIMSTDVRGKVAASAVNARLAKLDEALAGCWTKAGATGPVELVLRFGIKWNGQAQAISLVGGSEALHGCVRAALPTSGWPQPRDGGEAKVTRTWKLAG